MIFIQKGIHPGKGKSVGEISQVPRRMLREVHYQKTLVRGSALKAGRSGKGSTGLAWSGKKKLWMKKMIRDDDSDPGRVPRDERSAPG